MRRRSRENRFCFSQAAIYVFEDRKISVPLPDLPEYAARLGRPVAAVHPALPAIVRAFLGPLPIAALRAARHRSGGESR
jgi:hypothetical protein